MFGVSSRCQCRKIFASSGFLAPLRVWMRTRGRHGSCGRPMHSDEKNIFTFVFEFVVSSLLRRPVLSFLWPAMIFPFGSFNGFKKLYYWTSFMKKFLSQILSLCVRSARACFTYTYYDRSPCECCLVNNRFVKKSVAVCERRRCFGDLHLPKEKQIGFNILTNE